MSYSHRFFLYGPVGLFTALLLATMGYWWFASNAFSHRLDALNGHDIAPGVHFSFASKSMAGFPFRVDSELDGMRIAIATAHGPAIWTAEHFALHSLTYGRTHFIFEAAGKQHIEWHNDAGALHTYDFLPGTLRASVLGGASNLTRFDLDLIDDDAPDVSAVRVQLHLRKDPTIDGIDLFVSADGMHIAPELKPAFGPDVKHIALNALISPGSSFDGFLAGHEDWRSAVANWHARKGGLLVKDLQVSWGALNATGKGALAVDDLHRPLGAVHLQITNWPKLLQDLTARDVAKKPDAGLAAGFAAFVAVSNPAADQMNTTLTAQDGVLFVGSVPADLLSALY